jgi:hypothetical protein
MSRLRRLRPTARGVHLREIARPSRGPVPGVSDSCRRASTVKAASLERSARSKTHRNSAGLRRRRSRGKARGSAEPKPLGAETLATLGAAGIEHLPASVGLHASAETVRALALQNAGLEGSLHDTDPLEARRQAGGVPSTKARKNTGVRRYCQLRARCSAR